MPKKSEKVSQEKIVSCKVFYKTRQSKDKYSIYDSLLIEDLA